jgi:uncharacterized protein (TIGR03000 family)
MKRLHTFRWAALVLTLLLVGVPGQGQPDKKDDKKEDAKEAPATVVVRIVANAKLVIEDQETMQTGAVRKFSSPPLKPGKVFHYTLVATWEPNNYTKITRKRKVAVEAGKETEVDMTKKDDKQPDEIVVRYVPTPDAVVEAMCKLGEVGKDDVVFDLGCGDGRIVITAVKKYGAKRGVGVDIDPERIKDSNAAAKEAKVEDKVKFREGDVLKEIDDLADASVVMLYMGNDLNLALRPVLWKKLKPGTRVVSHRFTMGDWKPLKTETLTVEGEKEKVQVHLWKIEKKEEKKDDKKDKDGKKDKE